MKLCKCCSVEKDITFFPKRSWGYESKCKECKNLYARENRSKYRGRYKYPVSKEYQILYNKEYREKNGEKISERCKKYYIDNRDKIKEYQKNNVDIEYQNAYSKKYRKDNIEYFKKYRREYESNRRNVDTLYKLIGSVRSTIKNSLLKLGHRKSIKTEQILGCSFCEFKLYLESKFESWMTWENKGLYNGELNYGWDIDHIKPLSLAKSKEDILSLNNYINLQPLCSKINRDIKRNKI